MEELISKKDLLSVMNISYGQLYRWKRMNIIPEDWFIRKSTPTGQETFFIKDKICERIELILSMKEDIQLDEIAKMLNKSQSKTTQLYNMDFLIEKEVISSFARDVFYTIYAKDILLERKHVVILQLIERLIRPSIITSSELNQLLSVLDKDYELFANEETGLYILRKLGVSFIVGGEQYRKLIFDNESVIIAEINIRQEELLIERKLQVASNDKSGSTES